MAKACALAVMLVAGHAAQLRADDEIGGTGRIQPRDGVVLISGVPGVLVRTIPVHEGDTVKRGDLLMTLDDDDQRAELDNAQIAYDGATKIAEQSIAAQALAIQLATERLRHVESDASTYRALGQNATSEKETANLDAAVEEARMSLEIERIRDREIRADHANAIESATKRLEIAKNKIANYKVVAPSDGVILRIDRHVGERLTGEPAVELADTTAMYVICQVFQGELLKIQPGMKATIKSGALDKPLTGTVEQVGRLVDTRAQLGDVRIKLDSPDPASRLVGMEVEVQIAR